MQHQNNQVDLFTSDLYQFTCSYAYFQSNKHNQRATFEIFFRKYPFSGQYTILGGIRSIKKFLNNIQFTQSQEQYLRSIFPHMKQQYFTWLRQNIKGKIQIKSIKEGSLVFAKEPLITYTGPISIVQLLETPFLNLVGFSSLVATNASRMVKAVYPKKCLQFGTRRAQGPNGSYTASQFAYLGGFYGTSNINIGRLNKIPCVGTMSHAYVTSFKSIQDACEFDVQGVNIKQQAIKFRQQNKLKTHDGEFAAFLMYAKAFPKNFTCLIDTYDVINSGLLNTIIISKALQKAGINNFGLRLDSGDLRQQSIECRKIWNEYFPNGPNLTIIASDDLHEQRLVQMQQQGNQIDIFAIGTNIATCKKQPALGLVCKLVELDGTPKMKFSADEGKATYPSNKSVYRVWKKDRSQILYDIIALQKQNVIQGTRIVNPSNKTEIKEIQNVEIELLNNYWNQTIKEIQSLEDSKKYYEQHKQYFEHVMQIKQPKKYSVFMTQSYLKVFEETLNKNRIQK